MPLLENQRSINSSKCNVVAGLYAWQFALPVNGFIIPANNYLTVDLTGNPLVLDSINPLEDRADSDPSKA